MYNVNNRPFKTGLTRYVTLFISPFFLLTSLHATAQLLNSSDHPVVWLRADNKGTRPGSWIDATGKGFDASVFGQPVLQPVSLNYNPAFTFNGKTDSVSIPCNADSMQEMTIMAVFQPADTVEAGIWGAVNATAHKTMMTTRRITGPDGSTGSISASGQFALLSTVIQNWNPSLQLSTNGYMLFGSSGAQSGMPAFKGKLAELLIFDRSLDVLTQIQYETYLAVKYGIPLTRGNYVSAAQAVLWNAEKNKDYSHHITALGRDDFFSLHQKQAASAVDADSVLVISHGKLMVSNSANADTITNGNFLIWGDNNKALTTSLTSDKQLNIINRQWLMSASGATSGDMKTTLQLNQSALRGSQYWLVINPGAYPGFPVDSLRYYFADTLTAAGMAMYKNVQWDTDHSGNDLFGFVEPKDLLLQLKVVDSPDCAAQDGKARFQAIGGQAPFQYTITNNLGELVVKGSFPNAASTAEISDLAMGTYGVVLTDSKGHQSKRYLTMPVPKAQQLNIGLAPVQLLASSNELLLDAGRNIPAGEVLGYQWKSASGFNSASAAISVREPGIYTVSVTSRAGCVFTDTVTVIGNPQQHMTVYPSPSPDGNFTISVSLPKAETVNVTIYDSKGNKIQEMTGTNNTEFRFSGHMISPGLYTVSVKTSHGLESRKLLIL
ncbi:hypothetical protein A4H97_30025 [Niastella yeongjuensis]|uniref:Uncharacterized protein n=1 Tax=Niastella yeongjuensis TaxID=354355 RepID=A0A1V9EPI3_9BACT|nr:T9SS type A sorting domain-containing protein [Niastella yeongjuensis]OQP48073.1 hypothetical protein A4H97_30025 [Niastella yeongjuensis]SEO25699.1 Por secretion system C-terminal sorting domain-containing protein [Niastella yeongjuensis]